MSNFKMFQQNIKALGGIWQSEDVYFSQFRDGYSAAYKPNYPKKSINDKLINSADGINLVME